MDKLFITIVNNGLVASWIILAVIVLRKLLNRIPKWVNCLLWGLVAIRLAIPFSIESIFSLIPSAKPVPADIEYAKIPKIDSGMHAVNTVINPVLENHFAVKEIASVNPIQVIIFITSYIWLIGVIGLLIYAFVSFIMLKRQVKNAQAIDKGIFRSGTIDSPFILGFVKPSIYIPDYLDDEAYICNPYLDTALIQELNEKSAEEINAATESAFYKIYLLLNWKKQAWNIFHRFLIEGVLCYEITYDDLTNPRSITGIVDIDPATITRSIEDGITYWIQFKDVIGRERKLLDSQIIYIKYEDSGVSTRQSYLERLIRPFNIYRIVEQAQVIWTVTQSSFKTMFTIPINGMNRAKGMQTLSQAMNRYKEDISFNTETGELQVNGKMNMPFNKEYWMPENENGKPEIETLVDSGPQLNDSDQLKYFEDKLFKMSKIPSSRFDKDAQSTWFGSDPTQQLREEINFGRYVSRLRNVFAEIMLKPLKIQLTLQIPDIKNDKRILDSISLRFNSYNQFEEMANIEIMSKRVEFIGTMKDSLVITDDEGNEEPYFSPKFLILKYLKMSEADLELNEKYKLEEKLSKSKNADNGEDEESNNDEEQGGENSGEEQGGGDNGSESDEGSGDIDDEMLGDVQPESPETTQA